MYRGRRVRPAARVSSGTGHGAAYGSSFTRATVRPALAMTIPMATFEHVGFELERIGLEVGDGGLEGGSDVGGSGLEVGLGRNPFRDRVADGFGLGFVDSGFLEPARIGERIEGGRGHGHAASLRRHGTVRKPAHQGSVERRRSRGRAGKSSPPSRTLHGSARRLMHRRSCDPRRTAAQGAHRSARQPNCGTVSLALSRSSRAACQRTRAGAAASIFSPSGTIFR